MTGLRRSAAQSPQQPANPAPIAEYENVDSTTFARIRASGQPAVLRGLASAWPAVAAARRSDDELVAYLRRFAGDRVVTGIMGKPEIEGRFFYTSDFRDLNFTRGSTTLEPFLAWLLREKDNPHPHAGAVQSEKIPALLPGFELENRVGLVPDGVEPRAWIGNRVRVAAHYDLVENIGVVVAGRRRFTLFPPEELKNLYVGPFELTPAGTPISLVDPLNPDLARFPKFAEALKRAQTAELSPGDAIYIPIYWWHAVDSLEPVNLFVNYWWAERPRGAGSPNDALMYALFAIKLLPPEQRNVWRDIFDHYVFEVNGDPAEHLPPQAKGVLGRPTPEVIARMRDYIRMILTRFQ